LGDYLSQAPESDDERFNWNALGWHNLIVRIAERVANPIQDVQSDCWMIDTNLPNNMRIKTSSLEYRMDRPQQGFRLLTVPGSKPILSSLYRTTTALFNPKMLIELQESDSNFQAAHRCKHDLIAEGNLSFNPCFNPRHIVITDDKSNKDMDRCFYGAMITCPHNPKCIWTDSNGVLIPCRNIPNRGVKCTHKPCCWIPNIVGFRKK
jgi:hypothetical protein